ncbi:MAG: putative lipid II flippase FtsW [Thermoanaerobaculia bacterium]|nr:putative lipid II flippase FtsW [Thermoanaerobaculia bacterium]
MATSVTPIGAARSARSRVAATSATIDRRVVLLLLPVAMLVIVGLGALLSASSVVALRQTGDHLFFFKRQVVFVGVGVVAFLVAARIPYRWYARAAFPLLVVAVLGLAATLAVGEIRGGARRWIDLGPISLQTSEFAKFAVITYLATVLARNENRLRDFWSVASPVLLALLAVGVPLLLQPDLGTTLIITAASLGVVAASTAPLRYVAALVGLGGAGGLLLAYVQPYRWARIQSFLNPDADPLGAGLQAFQSLVALGTGGWFGVGLGASRARWSFLPNAHTDFIFAIIGEETGLAGALVVVALFLVLAVVGSSIAMRASDTFGRLLALGIVSWLTIQALINIGGVTRVLPITGVPLPFVSSGGSAMILNLAALGVLVNIARTRKREEARAS